MDWLGTQENLCWLEEEETGKWVDRDVKEVREGKHLVSQLHINCCKKVNYRKTNIFRDCSLHYWLATQSLIFLINRILVLSRSHPSGMVPPAEEWTPHPPKLVTALPSPGQWLLSAGACDSGLANGTEPPGGSGKGFSALPVSEMRCIPSVAGSCHILLACDVLKGDVCR